VVPTCRHSADVSSLAINQNRVHRVLKSESAQVHTDDPPLGGTMADADLLVLAVQDVRN